MKRQRVVDRFQNSICLDLDTGCWLWRGMRYGSGYGQFSIGQKKIGAHSMSWLLHRGSLIHGLNVLHQCDVTACCNPNHLFLGTQKENIQDMISKGRNIFPKKKSHCINGHQFSKENTYPRWNGTQACRRCRSDSQLRYKSRNLESVRAYQRERARILRALH